MYFVVSLCRVDFRVVKREGAVNTLAPKELPRFESCVSPLKIKRECF